MGALAGKSLGEALVMRGMKGFRVEGGLPNLGPFGQRLVRCRVRVQGLRCRV